jgi:ribosomal protein S18 acetylase RimI-like enzyme
MVLLKLTAAGKRSGSDSEQSIGRHSTFLRPFVCSGIPRRLKAGRLRIRPLSIFDGPFLRRELGSKDVLKANGMDRRSSASWLALWWWFKKTYALPYCIEAGSKRIGFLGLFNIDPGESAELSLVIFSGEERRLGYGTAAFKLLTESLRRCILVERIVVRVKTDNHAALTFWSKLGFEESGTENEIRVMSMCVEKKGMREQPALKK